MTTIHTPSCPIAKIGDSLSKVETPSLILDMDAFERNLLQMKTWIQKHNQKNSRTNKNNNRLRLRPHAKTHKTAEVALLQIKNGGAEGVCVQKLDEAFAMVNGGVNDVFLTNQVIGKTKINRLLTLLNHPSKPKLSILVDDIDNIHEIASEYHRKQQQQTTSPTTTTSDKIGILIEINGGQNRCGICPSDETTILNMCHIIHSYSNCMIFKGIHCYNGALQHVRTMEERKKKVLEEPVSAAKRVVELLEKNGVECEIVTGGGTGTFEFEALGGIYNEIQPGSYIFMDNDYKLNEPTTSSTSFENALFLHTSIVSTAFQPNGRAVVDAGMKAASLDSGPPVLTQQTVNYGICSRVEERVIYECGGDEHGILIHDGMQWKVGDMVRLIPGHIDPTVNMHDWLICVRSDGGEDEPIVENLWRIGGRGPGL